MRIKHVLILAVVALVAWPAVSAGQATAPPSARIAAATCDDYANQAEAQRAKDTRDGDGDGIYCEDLPCPCLPPDPRAGGGDDQGGAHEEERDSCTKPTGVQRLVFDKDKYSNVRRHVRAAIRRGWPRRSAPSSRRCGAKSSPRID